MLDVLTAPHVELFSNKEIYIVEVGLLGQIHIRVGSVILEEAEKIAEFNSTLIVIDVDILVA